MSDAQAAAPEAGAVKARRLHVGALRPSQLITTFGVGALVDLPHISGMVMGLDEWPVSHGYARAIHEDRLLAAVQARLGPQVSKLFAAPVVPETTGVFAPFDADQAIGVPLATFPRWMVCPSCKLLAPLESDLFQLKPNPFHPDHTRYVHVACGKSKAPPPVVPARFLVACENGHLDDFPWIEFVHRGEACASPSLRLWEFEPSGEARDLVVKCEACGKTRPMSDAFGARGKASMPYCRGRRPHLRDFDEVECSCKVTTVPLGASHLWFPDTLSALALPVRAEDRLGALVEEHWSTLHAAPNKESLEFLRTLGQLGAFAGHSVSTIWAAVEAQRNKEDAAAAATVAPTDLKTPEWTIFSQPLTAPAHPDLRLRSVAVPDGFGEWIDKIVLVEQLREVQALIGFTRIEAPSDTQTDGAQLKRMRLSAGTPGWVPASETRGEGIFVQFREEAIQDWATRRPLQKRANEFHQAHTAWRRARGVEPADAEDPGLRYLLLHSFSHALMRRFCLECGYAAASLKERIYARNPDDEALPSMPMAGVLIYTAASDSEGTLGGLVTLGDPEQLGRHMTASLAEAHFCDSDPLCAERTPGAHSLSLHAAACHACLFAPETACERGNRYLDRSVLVPTVDQGAYAFFRDAE